MLLTIDPNGADPLFLQIAAAVRAEVAAGRLTAGERLPPAREVADGLGVNLHTVLHAYQELRDEGVVDLRRGRGAIVTGAAADLADLGADIRVLVAKARARGISARSLGALVTEAMR